MELGGPSLACLRAKPSSPERRCAAPPVPSTEILRAGGRALKTTRALGFHRHHDGLCTRPARFSDQADDVPLGIRGMCIDAHQPAPAFAQFPHGKSDAAL